MFLNQQLATPRVLRMLTPRVLGLVALFAAAVLLAGCQSTPEPMGSASAPAPAPARAQPASEPVDDMTATEAAIAAMNEVAQAEAPAQTAQLIRPDAPMNYTVKRGDTLWDIAAVFLKDPWFWPEIWQINPQVENPHLIYPGDVLSLAYGAGGDANVFISQYSGARLQPRLRSEDLDGPVDALPFSAIAAFLSKPSVVTEEEVLAAPHIFAFRDEHMIGGEGHEAYVRNLKAPVNQRFNVMHVGHPIVDFETNELVGYQAAYVATAVVNAPGVTTKAMLTEVSREALRGDRLIQQAGEQALSFTPHAPPNDVEGHIIAIADEATEVGNYQVVILNRGARHGLSPGAVLAVDQRGELVQDVWGHRPFGKDYYGPVIELPFERAGTMIVFKVFNRVSYALVIGARSSISIADRFYNASLGSTRAMPVSYTQYAPAAAAGSAVAAGGASGDSGTIVFFREKKFLGAAVRFKVRENGVELCKLQSGSFCIVNVAAGTHNYDVKSEAKDTLTLEVEAGETYFVQGSVSMGAFVGHPNLAPSDNTTFESMKPELKDNTGVDLNTGD